MTSTPVKDMGSVMRGATQTFVASGKTAASGFQQILSQHTDQSGAQRSAWEDTDPAEKAASSGAKTAADSLRAKEPSGTKLSEKTEAAGDDELTQEELERALEMLGSVSAQLMEEIAGALGMTQEELQSLLGELNMQPMDLLNPEQLSSFLLSALGAEDSFSLLTDGELYQSYRSIMDRLNALLEQTGEALSLSSEQLVQLAEQAADGGLQAENAQDAISVEILTQETEGGDISAEGSEETGKTAQTLTEGNNAGAKEVLESQKQTSAQSDEGNGRQTGQEQGQNGNILLQNLRAESLQPQQASDSAISWSYDTQDIMRQIMDYMKIQIKPGVSSIEMQLHPESLGTVHVQVISKGGAVTAHFVTQNETVKAALESQMVQLKESFSEQGVKIEAVEVTVQTHQFERNLEQGRGRRQEENHPKSRSRKINLNDAFDMQEMDEEEMLEADMMAATGSTVNFTA